jgi:hypothetical protein
LTKEKELSMDRVSNRRARNLGLTGGSLWLISAGSGFAALALLSIQSNVATCIVAGVSVMAIALVFFGIGLIRKVRREPQEELTLSAKLAHSAKGKSLLRQFLIIFALEIAGICLVNTMCGLLHHRRYVVPLDLIIVGLHFLPLARLFEYPRYYVTGILFCGIPIVTMLATQSSAHVGQGRIWFVIPSIGCALVAVATGIAGLNVVRRSVNGFLPA